VKPTIFLGAPALLEKIREKVFEKSRELGGFGGTVFNWSLKIASEFNLENPSLFHKIQHALADRMVFKKLRQIMGGEVRFIMAGGAAIPVEVMRFFWALDIPVYEGYGLSECHIISVNTSKAGIKFGTVGPLFGETQVELSDENEILAKNPYMLNGYYKDDALTASSFTADGYFRTGDKGEWDGRFLKVVGRVKDIFKIGTGRYISPEFVEKKINESRFIQQSIVIGFNRPFISALIVPAFEVLKAHSEEWSKLSDLELSTNSEVRKLLKSELKTSSADYMESERVQQFSVMAEPFSIEKGELTPSSKLKRLVIEDKYAELVSALYDNGN
jgi:long-chain acyl-CoA synthetase